jgi:hypothetical protein
MAERRRFRMAWPIIDEEATTNQIKQEAYMDMVHGLWEHEPPLRMVADPRWTITERELVAVVDVVEREVGGAAPACSLCALKPLGSKEAAGILGVPVRRVLRHSMRSCEEKRLKMGVSDG